MTAARPLLLAALATSLGCATTMSVQTEFNAKEDFAKFKTYDFLTAVPGEGEAPTVRNPVVRQWINVAIERELAAKGCSRAPTGVRPDFLVSYHAWGKTKVEVSQYGYSYYGGPYYYGYGPYPYGAVTDVREYKEGTFVLDFVNAETKLLAWRGTASGSLAGTQVTPDEVNDIVHGVMAGYPPAKK